MRDDDRIDFTWREAQRDRPKVKPNPDDYKEVDFTWRHDEHQAYNVMNIKAGQTTKVPKREARRMQLNGHGTIGKTLKPHVHDQAACDKFMKEEAAKYHNPELDPKPGSNTVIGSRYRHKFSREGWGV